MGNCIFTNNRYHNNHLCKLVIAHIYLSTVTFEVTLTYIYNKLKLHQRPVSSCTISKEKHWKRTMYPQRKVRTARNSNIGPLHPKPAQRPTSCRFSNGRHTMLGCALHYRVCLLKSLTFQGKDWSSQIHEERLPCR